MLYCLVMHRFSVLLIATLIMVVIGCGGNDGPPPTVFVGPTGFAPLEPTAGPEVGVWREVAEPPVAGLPVLLDDGTVLAVQLTSLGGRSAVYLPLFDEWVLAGDVPFQWSAGPTRVSDGRVMVTGRLNTASDLVQFFDPISREWSDTVRGNTQVPATSFAQLRDGRTIGVSSGIAETLAGIFDPVDNGWTNLDSVPGTVGFLSPVVLNDGRVLFTGSVVSPTLAIYDPDGGTWSETSELVAPRSFAGLMKLSDGRVLYAGGVSIGSSGFQPVETVEVYDPSENVWSVWGPSETIDSGFAFDSNMPGVLPDGSPVFELLSPEPGPRSLGVYDQPSGTWSIYPPAWEGDGRYLLLPGRQVMALANRQTVGGDAGAWIMTLP